MIERLEQKGLVARTRNCDDKRSFFVRLTPEGASFARAVFFSTRSPSPGVLVAPRLRITFQRAFPFENP